MLTTNTNKVFSGILICIFLILISNPVLRMISSPIEETSTAEKRKLTPLPDIEFSLESLEDFPAAFERFFNDHFGHRKEFIHFFNYMKVVWFKTSPTKKYLVGRDGWLYLGDKKTIDDFRGLTKANLSVLKSWHSHLQEKELFFRNRGIRYLFVVEPDKKSVYPEYFPGYMEKISNSSMLDQLIDFLPEDTTPFFLDLRAPLLREKKHDLLYFKTDTHWNDVGAFIAYQKIIQNLQNWFPETTTLDKPHLQYSTIDTIGGNTAARMMLSDVLRESVKTIKPLHPCSKITHSNGKVPNKLDWKTGVFPKFPIKFSFSKKCSSANLKAVIFHDSFMVAVEPFLSEHFSEVQYIWNFFQQDILKFKNMIVQFKPDLVIEAKVERELFKNY